MRIVRFDFNGMEIYGTAVDDKVKAIEGEPWDGINMTGDEFLLSEVELLAPVRPQNVFAVGLNYKAHADEGWDEYPTAPIVFIKPSTSVIGPGEDILLPAMAPDFVDYEAELAIVIGRTCHRVSEEDVPDYVLGYTCGNDVTARDCQKLDQQWTRAKSFDTFCPLGPWIETDLEPDNTNVSLILNGETMQSANTGEMIFSPRYLVSFISQIATLLPGTVIITGTPAGVGFARPEPVFLKPGDKVEVRIEGIGSLVNGVRSAK